MTALVEPKATPILRDIAEGLNAEQARWLVDLYYSMQDYRIQTHGQLRAVAEEENENQDDGTFIVGHWLSDRFEAMESEVKKALGKYAAAHEEGRWAMSITGIGPVISAGLLAHIDIGRAPTVGHIWRFAGLDPTVKWGTGEKRPWNAQLKVLCWKIGDSFVKNKGRDSDVYGKVYAARKAWELGQNEQGAYAELAALTLAERKFKDKAVQKVYEEGLLPLGRIENRARRYATKLFLSHYHHVAHEVHFGTAPPKPYVLSHGDHAHFIGPPNWPL